MDEQELVQRLGRSILKSSSTEQTAVVAVASSHQHFDTTSVVGVDLKVYQMLLLILAAALFAFSLLAGVVCILWVCSPLSEQVQGALEKIFLQSRFRGQTDKEAVSRILQSESVVLQVSSEKFSKRSESDEVLNTTSPASDKHRKKRTRRSSQRFPDSLHPGASLLPKEDSGGKWELAGPNLPSVAEESSESSIQVPVRVICKHRKKRSRVHMTPAIPHILPETQKSLSVDALSCMSPGSNRPEIVPVEATSFRSLHSYSGESVGNSEVSTFKAWQIFAAAFERRGTCNARIAGDTSLVSTLASIEIAKHGILSTRPGGDSKLSSVSNSDPFLSRKSLGSQKAASISSLSGFSSLKTPVSGGVSGRYIRFYTSASDAVAASVTLPPPNSDRSVTATVSIGSGGNVWFDLTSCAAILGDHALTRGWQPQDRIEVSPQVLPPFHDSLGKHNIPIK